MMSSMPKSEIVSALQLKKALGNLEKFEKEFDKSFESKRVVDCEVRLNSEWFTLDARQPFVIFDK